MFPLRDQPTKKPATLNTFSSFDCLMSDVGDDTERIVYVQNLNWRRKVFLPTYLPTYQSCFEPGSRKRNILYFILRLVVHVTTLTLLCDRLSIYLK